MLKSFTFGCGQGATKAMITCIDKGILEKSRCVVVNSTTKDIPLEYQRNAIVISDDPNAGCGKVRDAAKRLMLDYINDNPNMFENIIPEDVDYINIIATSEGASGSGSSVVLAQYLQREFDIPIIITLITGFETDVRGLQNTINYFKDLNGGKFVINTISNKRFLDEADGNIFVAETLANESIANDFKIITANGIVDSDQNIDDTDHYKVITNPGIMFRGEVKIDGRIKNIDQFNKLIGDMIDNTTSLDFEASATKIGIYMNISEDTLKIIDTSFAIIKKKLCASSLSEIFIHKQNEVADGEYIRIIASGINLPKKEISDMFNKFSKLTEQMTKKTDDFFSVLGQMDTNVDLERNEKSNDDFFKSFDEVTSSDETTAVLGRNRRRKRFSSSSSSNSSSSFPKSEEKDRVSNDEPEQESGMENPFVSSPETKKTSRFTSHAENDNKYMTEESINSGF